VGCGRKGVVKKKKKRQGLRQGVAVGTNEVKTLGTQRGIWGVRSGLLWGVRNFSGHLVQTKLGTLYQKRNGIKREAGDEPKGKELRQTGTNSDVEKKETRNTHEEGGKPI